MRVVKSKPDADTVKGLVSRVADAIQLFTVSISQLNVAGGRLTGCVRQAGGVAVIEVKVENIERVATAIETTLEVREATIALLRWLTHAADARAGLNDDWNGDQTCSGANSKRH